MEYFSIRVRYTAGPARHDDAVVGIGTYRDASTMTMEINRLRVLTGDGSPWVFEAYDQDRYGCDLWADAWRVIQATRRMEPGDLDRNPGLVLDLFGDGTGEGLGWYHVIHDGDWVDVRDIGTVGEDAVVTATDGAATTDVDLVRLAFWFDREPGQTEKLDPLRLHMLDQHNLLNACVLSDDEVAAVHEYEHRGIDSHDESGRDWDYVRAATMLAEDQDEGKEEDTAAFNAHVYRGSNPGQSHMKPRTTAPKIYEEITKYTISILPPDDPWRRHYLLNIERRPGDNKWTILHGGYWANADGEWSVPCSGEHVPQHLFELDDALALARRIAPHVEGGGGRPALDVLNLPKEGRR